MRNKNAKLVYAITCLFIVLSGTNFSFGGTFDVEYDFDNDGKADLCLFNNGTWRFRYSGGGVRTLNFGTSNDVPVPDYYTPYLYGSAVSVWRPDNGFWYTSTGGTTYESTQFGVSGDKPVPFDYDFDSITDKAVFRNGTWYILKSSNNTLMVKLLGTKGDIPIPGNYPFSGEETLAVFRPSNSTWYIPVEGVITAYQFGAAGDQIVPGDYNGDYAVDMAVFRPSNGHWYIWESAVFGFPIPFYQNIYGYVWGAATDIPVPADYDGVGGTNIGVYRPSDQTWYILASDHVTPLDVIQFGTSGDTPIPNILNR